MKKLTHMLFDLDGTILDSSGLWEDVGETYLRGQGITPPPDLRLTLYNMSIPEAGEYFQKQLGLRLSLSEILHGIFAVPDQAYRETLPLKPGAKEFLQALYEEGAKVGLVTASDPDLTEAALVRLGVREYFSFILTTHQVGCGKENPLIYLEGARLLGASPGQTLVFEDTLLPLGTALKAGFLTVGVADPGAWKDWERIRQISPFLLQGYEAGQVGDFLDSLEKAGYCL